MNDTVLLITGISVFGLMSIAVVLTVMEFNSIRDRRSRRSAASHEKKDE
jgi:hypothetical protein